MARDTKKSSSFLKIKNSKDIDDDLSEIIEFFKD